VLPSRDAPAPVPWFTLSDLSGQRGHAVCPIAARSVLPSPRSYNDRSASRPDGAAVDILRRQIDEVLLAEAAIRLRARWSLASAASPVMSACSHARISVLLK